jgi:formylmethanofuran dehydrogenase subunit D
MENIVSIKGLSKAFGSHRVLKNIDLDVNIKKLDVKEGGTILAKNDGGKVVIRVESSGYDTPHQGIAYMPNSPWSTGRRTSPARMRGS